MGDYIPDNNINQNESDMDSEEELLNKELEKIKKHQKEVRKEIIRRQIEEEKQKLKMLEAQVKNPSAENVVSSTQDETKFTEVKKMENNETDNISNFDTDHTDQLQSK